METKNEMKHTPTPWILGAEVLQNGSETQNIDSGPRNKGGLYVANVFLKTDAAFIVRAVNSHEALLEVCRCLLVDLEYRKVEETAAMNLARRIITQAEGK